MKSRPKGWLLSPFRLVRIQATNNFLTRRKWMTAAVGPLPKIIGSSHCPSSLTTKGLHLRSVQPLFLIGWVRKSASLTPSPQWQFFVPKSDVSVFLSEFVSDLRARVTRPAGAGRATCGRGSLTICRSETGMTQSGMAIPDIKNRESLMKIGKVLMENRESPYGKSGKPYHNRKSPQANTKRPHAAGNVRSFMIVSRRIILHRQRPRLLE